MQDRQRHTGFRLALSETPRSKSLGIVLLLVAAGVSEGLGIMTLLPIVAAASNQASDNDISEAAARLLGLIGVRPTLGALVVVLILTVAAKGALFLLAMRQAGYAAADLATQLRLRLISSLMHARWEYYTTQPVGRLSNAVSSEAARASQMFTEGCYFLSAVVQVAIYITVALFVSLYTTVGAVVFGIVSILVFRSLIRISKQAGGRETQLLQTLIARLADGIAAIKPLKAMAREESLRPVLESETRALNTAQRHQILSRAALPAMQEPLIAVFVGAGLYVAVSGSILPFQELIFLAFLFHRTVTRIGNAQSYYQSVRALETAYEAITGAIRRAEDHKEYVVPGKKPSLNHSIQIDGVSFSYDDKEVLRGLDAEIPAHQLTAVVGPSGAGKTTLVDLLIGLLTPSGGRVFLDGVPLEEVDIRAWRTMVGYVPQEGAILHETVRVNIALADPAVGDEEIEEALKRAQAWEFVESLGNGLDSVVGERGIKLSGGQRQRLALARALVRKPQLLVLDEATTALDPGTERAICRELKQLSKDVTIIAISHQPAIVDVADNVLMLEPVDLQVLSSKLKHGSTRRSTTNLQHSNVAEG